MEIQPKDKSTGDAAHEFGKAILSVIPATDRPLQLLFENIFTAPLAKRKQAWVSVLKELLEESETITCGNNLSGHKIGS